MQPEGCHGAIGPIDSSTTDDLRDARACLRGPLALKSSLLMPRPFSPATPSDAEMKEEEKKDEAPKTQLKKKTVTKNIELPVVSKSVGGLSRESLETLAAVEASLTAQDTTEADRLNYKNAVEEYIYDIRDKVCGELEDFLKESDREVYMRQLTEYEDWLYDEGEDCEKNVYKDKLELLKLVGEPCKKRKYEFENRQMALDQYGLSIQLGRKMVDMFKGGDEKYNHLDKEEVAKVEKAIA